MLIKFPKSIKCWGSIKYSNIQQIIYILKLLKTDALMAHLMVNMWYMPYVKIQSIRPNINECNRHQIMIIFTSITIIIITGTTHTKYEFSKTIQLWPTICISQKNFLKDHNNFISLFLKNNMKFQQIIKEIILYKSYPYIIFKFMFFENNIGSANVWCDLNLHK